MLPSAFAIVTLLVPFTISVPDVCTTGVNVNTPVALSYANEPSPLGVAVVTLSAAWLLASV